MASSLLPPFETSCLKPHPLVGVDEVGRGCLAGPVCAAAVFFKSSEIPSGLTDSKLLSEKRREELSEIILQNHCVGLGSANLEEIEEKNILWASLLAMKRAVEALKISSGHLLIDGNKKIPGLDQWPQTTVVKGDLRVLQISAASIVAKVYRDQWMKRMAEEYPGYGFEIHKGYSTPMHKSAISEKGPCILHRRSFAGVKEHWHRFSGRI